MVRVVRVAATVFIVMLLGTVLTAWALEEAFVQHETTELAEQFGPLAPRIVEDAPSAEWVPRTELPPPVAVYERAQVHVIDDRYVVTAVADDGMLVSVATFNAGWIPGWAGPAVVAIALVLALGASALLTVPLLRRVRRLASHVEAFAGGRFDERADLPGHDEVAALAEDFNRMADQVQDHFAAQQALVQAIAHEYRTPLASARIAAALVAESEDAADRATQAQRLEAALDDLERLADEVRFYARAGEPAEAEPIDLATIVCERVERARALRELEWSVEAPESLVWSGSLPLVARVVDNLLANASRHAQARVAVTLEERTDGVLLRVDDDGVGIPEADRAAVFEPFVRLDRARSRGAGGHGLGLAIVGRMVRSAGGTVRVETAALGGASLRLKLPA
ncbi:MAG: ATP-binding protein [Myxococcota bacterium]